MESRRKRNRGITHTIQQEERRVCVAAAAAAAQSLSNAEGNEGLQTHRYILYISLLYSTFTSIGSPVNQGEESPPGGGATAGRRKWCHTELNFLPLRVSLASSIKATGRSCLSSIENGVK